VSARRSLLLAASALVALAACDDDPARPSLTFAVTCPTTASDVNAPLQFSFTAPVDPSTVVGSNIVVSDAATGFEVPGSLGTNGQTVTFTSSAPLPFDTVLAVRLQNLLPIGGDRQLQTTLCRITTGPAPIRELFWRALPEAGGTALEGVSLADSSPNALTYVISRPGVLYRRDGGDEYRAPGDRTPDADFRVLPQIPYISAGFDVNFADRDVGFVSFDDVRDVASRVLRTRDGGNTYDTLITISNATARRLYFRRVAPTTGTNTGIFGVIIGGSTANAGFRKYLPATNTVTLTGAFFGAGGGSDIDVANDTALVAGTSFGIRTGAIDIRGNVFRSTNGGNTWTMLAGAQAGPNIVTYRGVAIRNNGTIWVTGGNGFVGFVTPGGTTLTRVTVDPNLVSLDTLNVQALVFNDIQFARDNDQVGWLVGARQVGVVGGSPQFQGLIYMTRDGGQTWTRQGVRGAGGFGGEFPALNRLSVLSSKHVRIVGDAGTVLTYNPPQ
jgi:photosystem II stability/assembly factor-like uncharacterized protein